MKKLPINSNRLTTKVHIRIRRSPSFRKGLSKTSLRRNNNNNIQRYNEIIKQAVKGVIRQHNLARGSIENNQKPIITKVNIKYHFRGDCGVYAGTRRFFVY